MHWHNNPNPKRMNNPNFVLMQEKEKEEGRPGFEPGTSGFPLTERTRRPTTRSFMYIWVYLQRCITM